MQMRLLFERNSRQHASKFREHLGTNCFGTKDISDVISCGYVEKFDDFLMNILTYKMVTNMFSMFI